MASNKIIPAVILACTCIEITGQILSPTFDLFGSRRPGTTCTFNPCTIPNFCGPGRSCDIDENCISQCVCEDGSNHPDCVDTNPNTDTVNDDVNPSQTTNDTFQDITNHLQRSDKLIAEKLQQSTASNWDKTENIESITVNNRLLAENLKQTIENNKEVSNIVGESIENRDSGKKIATNTSDTSDCMFDPCETMSWLCDGGRKCVSRSCIVHCDCTPESTHVTCGDRSNKHTDTNKNENCGGFTRMKCLHGSCVQIGNAFSCQCDSGWKGPLCDQHASIGCTRVCQTGYECTWYQETMQICTPIQTMSPDDDPKQAEIKEKQNTINVCLSDYTFHHESLRNCTKGVICHYGVCVEQPGDATSCHCDPGAFGTFCNQTCCRDCGVGGECYIDGNHGDEHCRCYHNYTGLNCTEEKTQETNQQWYMWVVGSCSVVLVVLILVVVVIPYIMWKRRVLLVMKVVHYFQGYEDDDDREWDAFISYKSSPKDERFVTSVLFPKLEEEFGFTLNVHYRDFIPGDTIANNIIRAVKGSRRTILVITPQYVKGEYTKLEYQVAQDQMLKHRHRIIPILLEDISSCEQNLDPNLKFILRSVTYLEWPRDNSEKRLNKFWKRMQLSLPKKRNTRNIIQAHTLDTKSRKQIPPPPLLPLPLPPNGMMGNNYHLEDECDHYDVIRM